MAHSLISQMSLLLALIISCQGTSLSRENGEKIESAEAEVSYLVGTSWYLMRIWVLWKEFALVGHCGQCFQHWWHQGCKLLMLFLEIFRLYVSVFQYAMNIQVRNRLGQPFQLAFIISSKCTQIHSCNIQLWTDSRSRAGVAGEIRGCEARYCIWWWHWAGHW